MKKGLKGAEGADAGGKGSSKVLSKRESKKSKQQAIDTGVIDAKQKEDKEQNDSFEKYYNKDLDLDEDQVPVVIYELNESAINFISQESFEKGLILLQKAQTMLEQIQASKNQHDKFIFLLTLHNMALCYQKLGVLDECASCLQQCLQYVNSDYVQDYFSDPSNPSLRLKMLKYKCKTHMQICALLSQVHKHKEAALHANQAIMISHYLIHDTENICSYFTKELIQKKPLEEVSLINNYQYSLLEKTAVKLLPIFQSVLKRIAIEDDTLEGQGGVPCSGPLPKDHISLQRLNSSQPSIFSPANIVKTAQTKANSRLGSGMSLQVGDADMKNILGYLNQNEWIYSLNIGNIMQIAPLTLQDFLSSTAIQIELSREFVLEKLCFLAVSYFCMGTEFRFLHQLNETIGGVSFKRKDSEYWHGKAVELAISFLPSESPLVSHILMSYEKHHSPSNMAIPEDDSQDVKVRVVRQIQGIDSNRLQPIIRFHPDSDYRVQFIQMQPLDYYSIFGRGGQSLNSQAQLRRRNIDHKKAHSLNTQAGKAQANRPSSKTPSQPLTSKTGHSKNIAFSSANMPSSTTGAGAPSGHGGETISSGNVSGDENHVNDTAVIEDIHENHHGAPEENAIVEERERNLHSKKHRRQLLSPPSAAAGLQGVGAAVAKNGGNLTMQNGLSARDKEFMKLEDQKALTQKKAKRLLQNGNAQGKTTQFKTLTQHLQGRKSSAMAEMAEDEESQEEDVRGGKGNKAGNKQRPQTQVFGEIEVPHIAKERQRSSELGISNKYHRRLQTSIISKQVNKDGMDQASRTHEHDIDGERAQESQQQFTQERRARSSLSNRAHSGQGRRPSVTKGPAVSGAVATNASQVVGNSGFEVGQAGMLGLNSSQPLIFSKGQQNLELNTNLRGQINKNRSQLVDQLTNPSTQQFGSSNFVMDMQNVSGSTKNITASTTSGDRIQSRSQNTRVSGQNQQNLPQHNSLTSMQAQNSGQGQPAHHPKQQSSSRRFKGGNQASGNDDENGSRGVGRIQNFNNPTHLEMISSSAPMSGVQSTMASGGTHGPTVDKQTLKSGQRQSINVMNQKGAAPITDIRAKRQAATLNVEDLPGSGAGPGVNISGIQTTQSGNGKHISIVSSSTPNPHQLANQHMAQIHRSNKKFVEMASKANSNMLAAQSTHQQMLMNQFTKNMPLANERRIETFESVGPNTATNASTAGNNRASSQQINHTGSRSSKNAIVVQQNAVNSGPNGGKHNSSSSKRKASKKLAQQTQVLYTSQQLGGGQINNGLNQDQLMQLVQNKRDKFNNSAIVGGASRGPDDLSQAQAMMISNSNNGQAATNKVYNQKRTPTSFAGQSHENIPQNVQVSLFAPLQGKHQKSKEKNLKMAHQNLMGQMTDTPLNIGKNAIQMGHHMNFATNPNPSSVKGNLHQRTGSQLSSHSNQIAFGEQTAIQQQINRKSSIEAKIGGQAAVGGVIKASDINSAAGGEGAGQIRSKAQYDNWLQLQAMKKATGGVANARPQSNNNMAGSKAGGHGSGSGASRQ